MMGTLFHNLRMTEHYTEGRSGTCSQNKQLILYMCVYKAHTGYDGTCIDASFLLECFSVLQT